MSLTTKRPSLSLENQPEKITKGITIIVPDDKHRALRQMAFDQRIPLKVLMNQIIDDFLDKSASQSKK